MPLTLTPHHAKYFAHDLTRRTTSGMDRLSMALFDAAVDLTRIRSRRRSSPYRVASLQGRHPGREVGFGKTIEAGIVLCRLWAERRRRLLVICPASIRKQWALELEEKFNLPMQVLDAKGYRQARRGGEAPLSADAIVVMSHHYVNRLREELKIIAWDLVVIDEAHKLRNAYRPSNKVGQGIRWATEDNGMVFPPRRRSWTPRIRSRPFGDRRGRRVTLADQHEIQEKIWRLERQQRRQRQEIFKVEDEIIEKRDHLIDSLERRLAQRIETETLFTIRWAVT